MVITEVNTTSKAVMLFDAAGEYMLPPGALDPQIFFLPLCDVVQFPYEMRPG